MEYIYLAIDVLHEEEEIIEKVRKLNRAIMDIQNKFL